MTFESLVHGGPKSITVFWGVRVSTEGEITINQTMKVGIYGRKPTSPLSIFGETKTLVRQMTMLKTNEEYKRNELPLFQKFKL